MGHGALLVLFVSTGDAARGPIAQTLLNAKNSTLYRARSAGTAPLEAVHTETRALLESTGFVTEKLYPKRWQDFYVAREFVPVDVIVTLSEQAKTICPCSWPEGPVHVHWPVDDPLSAVRADIREWKFRKCFSTLDARISALVRGRPPNSREELWLRLKDASMLVG